MLARLQLYQKEGEQSKNIMFESHKDRAKFTLSEKYEQATQGAMGAENKILLGTISIIWLVFFNILCIFAL